MCCYQKMLKNSMDKYNNTNEKLLIQIKEKQKLWHSISKSEVKIL